MVFDFFIICLKISSICIIEMDVLSYSKNSQILHAASWQYSEQRDQLYRLQITNRNKVKNPVIDSVFESLMNFKRDSNLQEKSGKFSKICSRLNLLKTEFSWDHLYARI
jgi:hypothetical protein